jgi:hypothetical protein
MHLERLNPSPARSNVLKPFGSFVTWPDVTIDAANAGGAGTPEMAKQNNARANARPILVDDIRNLLGR